MQDSTQNSHIIVAKNVSTADTIMSRAIIYEGDTISIKTLDYVYLKAVLTQAQKAALAKYNRLRNAVYVTYPFARRAGM